jgi:hypothetical protein
VHLFARQYDPGLGRFVSADPVLGTQSVPQTLNRYPYVVNNPTRYTDPSGEACSAAPWDWGSCLGDVASAVGSWWNSLDPNVRGAIIIVAVAAAIVLTAGVAAVPLAGTALGSILMTAAVGATIGAVTDSAPYTGIVLATGGQ